MTQHRKLFLLNPSILLLITFLHLKTFAQQETVQRKTPAVIETSAGNVKVESLASFSEPWGMEFLPDGRLLITEKPGRLSIYSAGKLDTVRGIPKVEYHSQGGLLDVTIDPSFSTNNLVYLYFTEAAATQPRPKKDPGDPRFGNYNDTLDVVLKGGAVARARLDNNELKDLKIIWRQYPKTIGRGHFGGRLVFAADGTLFITSGERMRFDPAQDPGGTLGKVIRINSDGSIPRDNPFVNKSGTKPEIWSMGHRNPLGAAINPATQRLWMHEMGPKHGDELNIPEAGKNYGWPQASNGDNYDGSPIPDHPVKPQFTAPAFYWHPAISPSGLMFYTGDMFSKWKGHAFIGGMSSETLINLTLKGDKVENEERIGINKRVRDVIQAPDGSIWLLTDYKNAELLRLSPGQ